MKKLLIVLLIFLLIPFTSAAMQYPGRCEQRDFEDNGTHCLLPDGSSCRLEEFENMSCGEEYHDYCVPEGGYVWRQGYECCGSLKPYLPPMHAGQTTCRPLWDRIEGELKYNRLVWISIILLLLVLPAWGYLKITG